MKTVDVFVFASHREGTPRVVTEAMASRCPIVATNVDGIPEQVLDGLTGRLVPAKNPPALARATIDALRRRDVTRDMADRGMERARLFSVDAMVGTLRSQYAELEGVV
jgi:glycosyltransferase involved in cell wall biosynthesis